MTTSTTTALANYESKLPRDAHDKLVAEYAKVTEHLPELLDSAKTIQVTGPGDFSSMTAATAMREAVSRARIDVEHKRVELKAAPLLIGKTVDGMANYIKAQIKPVEDALREQEEYLERAQRQREEDLREARWTELEALDYAPESCADLGTMHADDYAELVANARILLAARQPAAPGEPDAVDRQRTQQQMDAGLTAGDPEKLTAFAAAIEALPVPDVSGPRAKQAVHDACGGLDNVALSLRDAIDELTNENGGA